MIGAMFIKFAIVASVLGFFAGCAAPRANQASVFKSNEIQTEVFSSSVSGR